MEIFRDAIGKERERDDGDASQCGAENEMKKVVF